MLLSGVTWAPRFSNGSRVVLPPARSFTRAEIHRRESYHLAWQVAVNHTRPVLHCRSTSNSSRAGVPRLPRITYSSDWTSIDIAELEKLLDSTYHRDNHDAQGSSRPQSADNDSSAESHGKRLQIAKLVSNSMLVIAAFVRSSSMPSFNASEEPGLSSDVEGDWKWVAEQRRHRRKRVLVGFVCVGGDRTLVSTLYNVVVHPELQGCGLGGKMILRACRNVFALGIGDVAVMAPNKLQGLFQACSFGPDQVCDSKVMLYRDDSQETADPTSHLKTSLQDLLKQSLNT